MLGFFSQEINDVMIRIARAVILSSDISFFLKQTQTKHLKGGVFEIIKRSVLKLIHSFLSLHGVFTLLLSHFSLLKQIESGRLYFSWPTIVVEFGICSFQIGIQLK